MKKELFIEKCRVVHGDKYDYSLLGDDVDYKGKIDIICPIHGVFNQSPNNHVRNRTCPVCAREIRSNKLRMSKEEFIKQARVIHGDKYDYSKVNYVDYHSKITIICQTHGEFLQSPSKHLSRSHGCRKCGMINKPQCQPIELSDFIARANEIHNNKYNYDETVYVQNKFNIDIKCPIHGVFTQLPSNHLRPDRGCPKCSGSVSGVEKSLLTFITDNYHGEIITNDRSLIKPLEIDIYLPDLKLAFEFNGIYWHTEKFIDKDYHIYKTELCEQQGVHLVHIYEDDWSTKQDIIKSRVLNLINKSNRIFARKCTIREVSSNDSKEFLNNNHIQGWCVDKIRLGLFYGDEMVSLMTFGKLRKNLGQIDIDGHYELLRFCNRLNTVVIGGADRLFKAFTQIYKPLNVISYADRSWTSLINPTVYDKLGFNKRSISTPNYYYVFNSIKRNRFMFRKDVLVEQGFDANKSEHEIMLEREIYRIYDCGNIKYEYIC